ncbi:hypothetical protein [Rhizorhabdus sp.]|uniref:hypothetical protein n=1 Tax=Rhizorhabdus sp. TaxID=1968843 RepID=UPI0019CBA6D7|nr:hypothetical protein [Rhizorhabdus sp.]MBD3759321.1 hypothetical protein [Rhizorhabdus sp.]
MKLYSPDKSLLIEIRTISEHEDGLLIDGKIMGAMPMKAIIRPDELRGSLRLLSFRVLMKALKMLISRRN